MANTTNLNLSKLAGTEKLKSFPSPYNDNMDAIDGAFGSGFGLSGNATVNDEINSLGDGLAIIANGNTHAAITSGEFVYVRGHGTLSNGLYRATANIAQDGTLSGSNLMADPSGGLNALNSNITNYLKLYTGNKTIASTDWTSIGGVYRLTIDDAFPDSIGIDKVVSIERNHIFTGDEGYWIGGFLIDATRKRLYIMSATATAGMIQYKVWYKE